MARSKRFGDDEVLDAAWTAILARGSPDFTLADLGQAVGLSASTLIQRFRDKPTLVKAILARDNARLAAALAAAPDRTGPAAVIAVFMLLTEAPATPENLPGEVFWQGLDLGDPDLNHLVLERSSRLRAAIVRRMPPLPLDPDEAAALVEAQWRGALVQWRLQPRGRLVDHVTAALADWFALVLRR